MLLRLARIAGVMGLVLIAWYYRDKAAATLLRIGFSNGTQPPSLATCSNSGDSAHCEVPAVGNTSLLERIQVRLATLQSRVVHALATIDPQQWLEEYVRDLQSTDWVQEACSSQIFLLLVPMLLSLIFRRWRCGGSGQRGQRENGTRVANSPPRCLSRHTTTADREPRFALARHRRPITYGRQHDDDHCFLSPPHTPRTGTVASAVHADSSPFATAGLLDELQAAAKEKRRLDAVRVIQRWARSTFQGWLLERASRSRFSTRRPRGQLRRAQDRDDGTMYATVVDYSDFSEAGLSRDGKAPSSKALLQIPEVAPDGGLDKGIDGGMRRSAVRRWEAPAPSTAVCPLSSTVFGKLRSAGATLKVQNAQGRPSRSGPAMGQQWGFRLPHGSNAAEKKQNNKN